MRFEELDAFIPWVDANDNSGPFHTRLLDLPMTLEGKGRLRILQPGRHWAQTKEPYRASWHRRTGGDFVITATDPKVGWSQRAFSHSELFTDFEAKAFHDHPYTQTILLPGLVRVVAEGDDPMLQDVGNSAIAGLDPQLLLSAAQALAVCERRRYLTFEPVGGRALPTRFASGIVAGRWTSRDAAMVVRQGQRGLTYLREQRGLEPSFTTILGRPLSSAACREDRDVTR